VRKDAHGQRKQSAIHLSEKPDDAESDAESDVGRLDSDYEIKCLDYYEKGKHKN
jgi:hypothetical protein